MTRKRRLFFTWAIVAVLAVNLGPHLLGTPAWVWILAVGGLALVLFIVATVTGNSPHEDEDVPMGDCEPDGPKRGLWQRALDPIDRLLDLFWWR